MPIIINELVIKATVDVGRKEKTPSSNGEQVGGQLDRQALIEECVEQMLKILEAKQER